jgi:hypothetical protein
MFHGLFHALQGSMTVYLMSSVQLTVGARCGGLHWELTIKALVELRQARPALMSISNVHEAYFHIIQEARMLAMGVSSFLHLNLINHTTSV